MVKLLKIQKLKENQQGQNPKDFSFVTFKIYNGKESVGQLHTCQLNNNQIKPEIQELVKTLKEGQRISYTYKSNENNSQEKNNILELIKVKEASPKRQPQQIAEQLKASGNSLIKDKKYNQAANKYKEAYDLLLTHFNEESIKIKTTYLNSNQFGKCIQMCQQYMQTNLQPNKKIVYRRAQAQKNLKNWDQALKHINFGLQICQNDAQGVKDFNTLNEILKKERKQQSQKQKKVYTKMFG